MLMDRMVTKSKPNQAKYFASAIFTRKMKVANFAS